MLTLHLLRASPTKAKAVKARSSYVIDFLIYVAVCSFYRVNNHSKQSVPFGKCEWISFF